MDKKKLKPNSFELIKLSIVMLVPLGFYFLFWFLIGDPHKLYHSGIKSAAEMGFKANYLPMTKKVWADVFYDYSVFTFLLFWATGNSFLEFNKIDKSKKLILYFSSFLIINLCFYKSLWPYNFANFLPVAFILIPWFIENYFSKYKISTKVILTSCSLLFSSTHLGVLKDFFKQRNKEQISEIQLAEAIVGRDHSYLSSFFLLFNNENAFPIAWIDDVFYEKTRSWSTDQVDDYIKLIDSKSPYLLIYDKRLALNLRPEFLDYLKTNFKHFNGSLYTRSYQVNKEQTELQILKAGIYRLIGKTKAKVHINNILVKQGSILELAPDTYKIKTKENIELQWIPDIPENLITNWTGEKKFFPTFVIQ
ncbi:MAG: hypothetical protein VX642_05150 [Bdellovibrionota bacterium]|nr:hypothetical protein [Bdellovibrionota bacterium]